MKKENFMVRAYNKIQAFLSLRNISWITIVVFVLLLLPICYLSFVNRATGDDYGYGAYTRVAFMNTHSLAEVWNAIVRTVKQYYYGWQGTWFSIVLFSLQPEVFSDKAYVVTTFLMLFLWISSTLVLFKEILINRIKMEKWSYILITLLFLIIEMQFVPSTRSSIFWYNGCAHYLVPFAMGQYLICLLLRFAENYKVRYLIGICILMSLLGGSNYQAALFALIVAVYVGIDDFVKKKNKCVFLLLVPMVLEMIGLVISIKAPGNKVRGGEEFGLSVSKAVETIGLSFVKGIRDIAGYVTDKPLVFVGLLVLFLLVLEALKRREEKERFSYPVMKVFALFCLYSAMQAPEIYANVEVSGGVWNMNYWIFLLMTIGVLVIVAEYITAKIKAEADTIHKRVVIPGIVICLFLVLGARGNLKESATYVSLQYIVSGQAADYKEQMDLQTELMTDENVKDVVVPFINDVQGPLMHMPITENPEAWTSQIAMQFYEKDSVVAIDRLKWNELYGGF